MCAHHTCTTLLLICPGKAFPAATLRRCPATPRQRSQDCWCCPCRMCSAFNMLSIPCHAMRAGCLYIGAWGWSAGARRWRRGTTKKSYTQHIAHIAYAVCACVHMSLALGHVCEREKKNKKMFVCTSRSSEKPTLS